MKEHQNLTQCQQRALVCAVWNSNAILANTPSSTLGLWKCCRSSPPRFFSLCSPHLPFMWSQTSNTHSLLWNTLLCWDAKSNSRWFYILWTGLVLAGVIWCLPEEPVLLMKHLKIFLWRKGGWQRGFDYTSTLSFSKHFVRMTFPKVALPKTAGSAGLRMQWNISLVCCLCTSEEHVEHRSMLLCKYTSRPELAPVQPPRRVGRIDFGIHPNHSTDILLLLDLCLLSLA